MPVLMPIARADPAVMIADYELVSEVLMLGDNAVLTLTITNAETIATVARTTTSGSTTTVTTDTIGATIDNVWITPAYDGDKRVRAKLNYEDVGHVSVGASFTICFEIVTDEGTREGLYLDILGKYYMIDDIYCINPKCQCEAVRLVFIEFCRSYLTVIFFLKSR